MGAAFNHVKLKGTPTQIREQFKDLQARDLYENGHSYSGGFGMCRGLQFERPNCVFDEQSAYDWLCENGNKWGPALALKLGDDEYMVGAWCAE